jgi:hypothetical protein
VPNEKYSHVCLEYKSIWSTSATNEKDEILFHQKSAPSIQLCSTIIYASRITGLHISALVIIQVVTKSNYNIMQKPDCYQTDILHRLEEKWIITTHIIEVAIHSVHLYNPFDSSKGRTGHVGEKDKSQEILSLRDQLLHLWQVEGVAAGISDWHTTYSTGWLSSEWERKIGLIFLLQTFHDSLCQNKEQECLQNCNKNLYLTLLFRKERKEWEMSDRSVIPFCYNAQENWLCLHKKKEKQVQYNNIRPEHLKQNKNNLKQTSYTTGTLNKETEFRMMWCQNFTLLGCIRIACFHPLQI